MKEYGFSFGFVFTNIHTFIGLYEIENSFMKDLLMLYGFTALGAVPKIIDYAKKKPDEVSKEVEQTFEFGNTVANTTETIDSDLMNGENSAKKFDEGFFN